MDEKQIAELEANREILNYKCRFYETVEKTGSIEALSRLGEKDIPGGLRSAYKKIKNGHL